MNVEELLEDIEFNKQIGMGTSFGSCKLFIEAIEIERLLVILNKHIPQVKEYFNGTSTTTTEHTP